jgi:hypothetical protein
VLNLRNPHEDTRCPDYRRYLNHINPTPVDAAFEANAPERVEE